MTILFLQLLSLASKTLERGYIRNGILSMVAFSLLFFVSLRPVRARAYEVFYFTHFSMVLCVLPRSYVRSR